MEPTIDESRINYLAREAQWWINERDMRIWNHAMTAEEILKLYEEEDWSDYKTAFHLGPEESAAEVIK
jgi:hypothetical protein